jgi:hypothetical protein
MRSTCVVVHKNVEPFEAVTEPQPVGSVTPDAELARLVVALPAGRGSVFHLRCYMLSIFKSRTPRASKRQIRLAFTLCWMEAS